MVSYNQKSHVTPNFNCLVLSNAVVTLTILSASCDTDSMPMESHD